MKTAISPRRTVVATDYRLPGRTERMVGSNGEFNAGSKREIMLAMQAALQEMTSGTRMITEDQATENQKIVAAHKESIYAAFSDPDAHRQLGEILAGELTVSANKVGFMRQLMKRQDLVQGQAAQIYLQMKNVSALVASSPTRVETQFVRDNWFYPPSFYISVRPYVEQRDINRANTDILEQKYLESMEGIMVAEDRVWRNLALQSVGVANEAITTVGTLTPLVLAQIRNQVSRWRIPASNLLIASDIWNDIVGDSDFSVLLDPVSKHELFLNGELGVVLGMRVYTDAYRHSTHHVLSQGEIWVVGEANSHGQYTDRGGVTSEPVSGVIESIPGRGWFMSEEVTIAIANAKSVAYATRS